MSMRILASDGMIRGSLYYQPEQCTIIPEIPENYRTFALFDHPQKIGNLMTPVKGPLGGVFLTNRLETTYNFRVSVIRKHETTNGS